MKRIGRLSQSVGLLCLGLLVYSLPSCGEQPDLEPTILLISLDGFRWDYLDQAETPHLDRMITAGVKARSLLPVFPTKTFPNHYSIITGLFPENHGLVSNSMYDPVFDATFRWIK